MPIVDVLLLISLAAIWGSSFIFMRFLAPLIGPVATADFRMLVAGIVLVAFFAATRFRAEWRKNGGRFLIIGLLNSAVPFLLYSVAALTLPASIESILNSLAPLFGAVFSALWLGDALTPRKAAGLVLGTGGVVAMSSLSLPSASTAVVLGVVACVAAPACYGLAGVYIKRHAAGVKPMAVAGGSQLLGGIALLPFVAISPPAASSLTGPVVAAVIVFAVVCSAVAYLIYYRLIADVGPTRALTVTFLIPVFGMVWGALLLGETITWSMVAGAAVILVGTYLVSAPRERAATPA
jgi:drug/metabolite transporter (DMT)-like permease